jgi:hypothetical protein
VKKFFITLGLSLLLAFSTFGESESESSQILLTGASGSNVDIDGALFLKKDCEHPMSYTGGIVSAPKPELWG